MREKELQDPRADCLRYLARTAYPTLYQARDARLGLPENEYQLLTAFYDNASPTLDALRKMGVFDGHVGWVNERASVADFYAQLTNRPSAAHTLPRRA
jgi:hypothetical protein